MADMVFQVFMTFFYIGLIYSIFETIVVWSLKLKRFVIG